MNIAALPDSITKLAAKINFDREDEKIVFNEFQIYVANGMLQKNEIKTNLGGINENILILPTEMIYKTIKMQNTKLQILNAEFRKLYDAIRMINESAFKSRQKCEQNVDECQANQISLHALLESSKKTLARKEEELQEAIITYDKNLAELEDAKAQLEDLRKLFKVSKRTAIFAFTVSTAVGFLINPILAIILLPLTIYTTKECIIYFNKGLVSTAEPKLKAAEVLKIFLASEIEAEKEKRNNYVKDLENVNTELVNCKKMHENEILKLQLFGEIIDYLCKFQISLKDWQEPLAKIINVFEAEENATPPSNLKCILEREQRRIVKNVLGILDASKQIYDDFCVTKC